MAARVRVCRRGHTFQPSSPNHIRRLRMRRFTWCLTLFLLVLVCVPHPSAAQIPVTDAAHIATSVWAEVARYAQAIEDFLAQAEQIYNQYQQIQYQLQALS